MEGWRWRGWRRWRDGGGGGDGGRRRMNRWRGGGLESTMIIRIYKCVAATISVWP